MSLPRRTVRMHDEHADADLDTSIITSLRTICREFLRAGIGADGLQNALRKSLAEVGAMETSRRGRSVNQSRVSALTGIGRRELRTMISDKFASPKEPTESSLPPTLRVVNEWRRNQLYRSTTGRPRKLAFRGAHSFSNLVRRVAGDLQPTALRLELIRLGHVRETADGLRLLAHKAGEQRQRASRLVEFSHRIGDFADSASTLLYPAEQQSRLRTTQHVLGDSKLAAAFEKVFSDRADDLLKSFEQWISSRSKDGAADSGTRLGVGIYLIRGEESGTDILKPKPKPGNKRPRT
jgi:Family of unknown function (DUF6502)